MSSHCTPPPLDEQLEQINDLDTFTIPITELTDDGKGGEGALDVLMSSLETHIHGEYKQGRIKGNDYAQVYLGLMQSALSEANQFTLNRRIQGQQETLLKAQTLLTLQQAQNARKEYEKVCTEVDVLNQQLLNLEQDRLKTIAEKDVLEQQRLKIIEEKNLIIQKKFTEQSQILDTVDGNPVAGVIGKQKELLLAQTNGFARDAEQKAAKIYADTFAVMHNKNPTLFPGADYGFSPNQVEDTLVNMRQGLGKLVSVQTTKIVDL